MKVLAEDILQTSTILETGIETAPGHPIENILDARLSHNAWILPAGFTGSMYAASLYNQDYYMEFAESAGTTIDFDLNATREFRTMCVAGNNFTNIDYTISWALTDINVPDGTFTYQVGGPEWTSFIELADGLLSARYVRLVITDAQQTDQYLQIGRVAIGVSQELPDFAPIYDVDYISNGNMAMSQSRQLYGGPVVIYRRVNITYPYIEDKTEIVDFFRQVDVYNPFFVQFDDKCPMPEAGMYAKLSENTLPLNYSEGHFFKSRLSFEEVY